MFIIILFLMCNYFLSFNTFKILNIENVYFLVLDKYFFFRDILENNSFFYSPVIRTSGKSMFPLFLSVQVTDHTM